VALSSDGGGGDVELGTNGKHSDKSQGGLPTPPPQPTSESPSSSAQQNTARQPWSQRRLFDAATPFSPSTIGGKAWPKHESSAPPAPWCEEGPLQAGGGDSGIVVLCRSPHAYWQDKHRWSYEPSDGVPQRLVDVLPAGMWSGLVAEVEQTDEK
jgi:hypothetical protein